MLQPTAPPYDPMDWLTRPFPERVRMVCQAWAIQGYGAPPVIYVLYALKVGFYIGMWLLFCSFSSSLGGPGEVMEWWFEAEAFKKAVLWTLLFEGLGLGCGSGPLTGRYWPPLGGVLHFARLGTTRLPPFPALPGTGGHRRGIVDVGLYAAICVLTGVALCSDGVSNTVLLPLLALIPILGLRDKTVFLAFRSEHYWLTGLCFLFGSDWIPGSKAVLLAIWVWAGFSKLNHHFPAVVSVMVSNSPVLRSAWLRKRMYRAYPDDLRPSKLAMVLAHGAAVVEIGVPLVLACSSGGWLTVWGLVFMICFHAYIVSCVPMAVPIEWNFFFVYAALVLYGVHADVSVLGVSNWGLALGLIVALVGLPILGNLVPSRVSFLMAMRYYAGNWPFSVWLFRHGSTDKLDRGVLKVAPMTRVQLARHYEEPTIVAMMSKVMAFRLMHLQGRVLPPVLARAVDSIDDYEYFDGELIAGLVLGWNFGDGHLHQEQLLEAVQAQCGFAPGELRCIFVEGQPLGRTTMHWRLVDAATGELESGHARVADLRKRAPWPQAEEWPHSEGSRA